MRKFIFKLILFALSAGSFAFDLSITSSDLKIVKDKDSGYHVYVLKKKDIESVLLTETSKDPNGDIDNYAYRAKEWNSFNGDEKRILNGKFLESEYSKFCIVDSTTEYIEGIGNCFHLYLPETMVYGYPWTRNGEVNLKKGTFINFRTYSLPYADYDGEFKDNPFMLNFKPIRKISPKKVESKKESEIEYKAETEIESKIIPEPEILVETENSLEEIEIESEPVLSENYNAEAAASFEELGEKSLISHGPESLIDDIMESLLDLKEDKACDVVFAIDATGSMKDDVDKLRSELIPKMERELSEYADIRLGLLLYRDYGDNFRYKSLPVKMFPFTADFKVFKKNLDAFTIRGNEGGDIPEAVYEALYGSIKYYDWRDSSQKKIILIGDAQPHPKPRGRVICTKEIVLKMSEEKNIHIDTIIVPDKMEE
ncbi:MAG: vWA domain-containing protein [Treponemataceae bacterium]